MLEESAIAFRHPVRLLIVNQTAPAELGLNRSEGAWSANRGRRSFQRPLMLSDETRLTEGDIRFLGGGICVSGNYYPLSNTERVRYFEERTHGNPLLVELGLRWLREGKSLSSMTEHDLLRHRVDRVIEALSEAGFDQEEHRYAAAAATLAGGATDSVTHRGLSTLTAIYHLPTANREELARVYPVDDLDRSDILPPIRPEMIGDAFVRRVIEKLNSLAEKERLVATAWAISSQGTLRSALRLGGKDDQLGALLRSGPPTNAGLDPTAVALAYADAAVWLPEGMSTASRDIQEARRLATLAEAWCNGLDREAAARFMPQILDLGEVREACRPFMADTWLCLVGLTFVRTEGVPTARSLGWLERLFYLVDRTHGRGSRSRVFETLSAMWPVLFSAAGWEAEVIQRLAEAYRPNHCHILAMSMSKTLSDAVDKLDERSATVEAIAGAYAAAAFLYRSAFLDRSIEAGKCQMWALALDKLVDSHPGDRYLQLKRAETWYCVAHENAPDPVACAGHARMVDAIAVPYPEDRDMQFERAQAWRCVAYASLVDPVACADHARAVDPIAVPYPEDRDMQLERALVWNYVAYATRFDAAVCAEHAQTVDAIAVPFPDDRDMQFERAQAWRYVAFATRSDPTACARHARTVDAIAAPTPTIAICSWSGR
ncbi:hypothetical protein MMSR116_05835 [Methylobacterium mesophilicum SR1.6/6]|uniref:Uncharacterized protein n=1 Tax=Methylobacterium mesophilicum SR1.6/6 TaxID=908290 RepID=A0A6B9FK08_9HYPH|nr:hypothetical protein [Methylobacterium mesophilicum]QGY01474.1 hypothetical protein MMSR116_05835 [Methylobacterium mesophilicum SR1.6/6]